MSSNTTDADQVRVKREKTDLEEHFFGFDSLNGGDDEVNQLFMDQLLKERDEFGEHYNILDNTTRIVGDFYNYKKPSRWRDIPKDKLPFDYIDNVVRDFLKKHPSVKLKHKIASVDLNAKKLIGHIEISHTRYINCFYSYDDSNPNPMKPLSCPGLHLCRIESYEDIVSMRGATKYHIPASIKHEYMQTRTIDYIFDDTYEEPCGHVTKYYPKEDPFASIDE